MPSQQFGTSGINSTVLPQGGFSTPTNPSNLPRYNPRVVNGTPFVTEPPCQFDAYDMVHPANYMQSYPVCGGPSVFPSAPPPGGSPYTYVPPTVTPNMARGYTRPTMLDGGLCLRWGRKTITHRSDAASLVSQQPMFQASPSAIFCATCFHDVGKHRRFGSSMVLRELHVKHV